MKTVYLIETDSSAPRLQLQSSALDPADLLTFDGRSKKDMWPKPAAEVRVAAVLPESPYVFYQFAPGALVIREDVLTECEDFYWVSRESNESLLLRHGATAFEVINIIDFLSPPSLEEARGEPPCPVDKYYTALFRIKGRPPEQLFCVSGVDNPLNEFKGVYDHHGFTGLRFTEIWSGD